MRTSSGIKQLASLVSSSFSERDVIDLLRAYTADDLRKVIGVLEKEFGKNWRVSAATRALYSIPGTVRVGMGATFQGYTDAWPGTVIEVSADGKRIVVQVDKCTELPWKKEFYPGGFVGHTANQRDQKWNIEVDPSGEKVTVSLRKNGEWIVSGASSRSARPVLIGARYKFYDFNF
jgi:hypothetical protein